MSERKYNYAAFSVDFSPDGKTAALGFMDNYIRILSIPDLKEVKTLVGHSDLVHEV